MNFDNRKRLYFLYIEFARHEYVYDLPCGTGSKTSEKTETELLWIIK